MAYTTIVTGTSITSSWANANVRDQVVSPFASSAARTSAITVPVNGMISTLTPSDSTNGIYHYNGTSWRAPWNLPWGLAVAPQTTTTAGSAITTTETVVSTAPTFTAVANRLYEVNFSSVLAGSVGGDIFTVQLRLTNASGTSLLISRYTVPYQGQQSTHQVSVPITLSAGSTVIVATLQRASGTGNLLVLGSGTPTIWTIKDIGPSGAPT